MLAPRLRLLIKRLKRASSKEIPCLNKFYKIYNKHSIPFSSPQKAHAFRGPPKLNQPFCLPWKGRWVQLVALGRIEKQPGHRVQAVFGALRFLQTGSTYVQLRLQENGIYLTFFRVLQRVEI